MPAQKDGPSPRTTTTLTSAGRLAPISARPCQTAGVIAFLRSGRPSVTIARDKD